MTEPDSTAAPVEPERLACGCDWITKYCDEHHYEIRQRAHDAGVRARLLHEIADSIGMNAPHLADMLNAYADGDERVGHYIGLHNEWILEGHRAT